MSTTRWPSAATLRCCRKSTEPCSIATDITLSMMFPILSLLIVRGQVVEQDRTMRQRQRRAVVLATAMTPATQRLIGGRQLAAAGRAARGPRRHALILARQFGIGITAAAA